MTDDHGWHRRAACLGTAGEMVPGGAEQVEPTSSLDGCAGVLLAKKICAGCPVVTPCRRYARHLERTWGRSYAQGVWGGLTLRERVTWQALGTAPRPCSRCGLPCVPIHSRTSICNACKPQQKIRYDDYRAVITDRIASGGTAADTAEDLGLNKDSLLSACRRWRVKIVVAGTQGRRPTKECGTLAAKTRHSRRGESWENCACKHVSWTPKEVSRAARMQE